MQGGEVGGGVPYKLTRANLAMSFGFVMNWNMFLEIPRQNGKTVSALCWYLWVFLFGTRNSKMLFLNKKLDDSKMNLQTLKDIRDSLPDYLRMNSEYGLNGKKLKAKNSAETISNLSNNNLIKTAPSARTKMLASNLGRGATLPFLYMDEYKNDNNILNMHINHATNRVNRKVVSISMDFQEINIFIDAIADELTGKQYKELKSIAQEYPNPENSKPKIAEKLKSFGGDVLSNIVANIVTNPSVWNCML